MNPIPPPLSWPLLARPDARGRLHYPSLEESVRQSIRIILQTRPGERLMRPGFGAGLTEFLHAPNTLATRRAIRERIETALGRWEPRILLDRVEVEADAERPDRVRIEIAWRLRRSGQAQRLGVTLEMEASADAP